MHYNSNGEYRRPTDPPPVTLPFIQHAAENAPF